MQLAKLTMASGKPLVFDIVKVQAVYYEGDDLIIDFGGYESNRFAVRESLDDAVAAVKGNPKFWA